MTFKEYKTKFFNYCTENNKLGEFGIVGINDYFDRLEKAINKIRGIGFTVSIILDYDILNNVEDIKYNELIHIYNNETLCGIAHNFYELQVIEKCCREYKKLQSN